MRLFHLAPQNLGHKEWPSHEGNGVEEKQARYVEDGVAKGELEGVPVFYTFTSYRIFFLGPCLQRGSQRKRGKDACGGCPQVRSHGDGIGTLQGDRLTARLPKKLNLD